MGVAHDQHVKEWNATTYQVATYGIERMPDCGQRCTDCIAWAGWAREITFGGGDGYLTVLGGGGGYLTVLGGGGGYLTACGGALHMPKDCDED